MFLFYQIFHANSILTLMYSTYIDISGLSILSTCNLKLGNKLDIELYNRLDNELTITLLLSDKICQHLAIVLLINIFTIKKQ